MATKSVKTKPHLLDPTAPTAVEPAPLATRPASLRGVNVALVGNGKENCELLFNFVERWLREECAVAEVLRLEKDSYWEPLPAEQVARLRAFGGVVITGLGS